MKKRVQKLQVNRETVHRLDPQDLPKSDLREVRGGLEAVDRWSSCGAPNCCGSETF